MDARGFTAFHCAVTHGNNEMVTILLEHPALDPNFCAADGRHALHQSIPLKKIALLINHHRIDPNMRDNDGYTIFHRAIMGHKHILWWPC
jgi:ankyrin repeat protein